MIDAINRLLSPVRVRVANMISRALVKKTDDSTKVQTFQISIFEDETRTVERFQNYGFTSAPKADAEAVVLFVGGRREHGIAIGVEDRRYRIRNLQSGEVAVYNDTGSTIVLKTNGDVEITPSSGTVKVHGDVLADTVSLKSHTHSAGTGLIDPQGGTITGATGGPL